MKQISILVVFLALAGCASPTPATPSEQTIQTAIAQTLSAQNAITGAPTLQASRTLILEPTNTPKPTNTPSPTKTSRPTNTPLPPTTTPEPIYISGSGDSIVDVNNNFYYAIIHIKGNAASRFFAVSNYGADGELIDLLVNETDPYDGVRPLDFLEGEHTTRFEVQAVGEWEIEILPISSARTLKVPGTIQGTGDDVIVLTGENPDIANIKGNAEGRFFAVTSYGVGVDLLVNTTDPYDGTVLVNPDASILEVNATGEWSIEIITK